MAKILIVDDSPTETYKLTNILERNGFSVLSADSGEQGVNLAKDEQPDVVLMDIVMPGLNGFQATRQLSRSKETKHIPVIIVTVRKVTSRILRRQGYRVLTAKDGVEALKVMQEEIPAVILLDIEMPRMDGFEVATRVRASRDLREVPIVMITSRTGEKHRQRAMELGVDHYMGKPYQEEHLLETLNQLLTVES